MKNRSNWISGCGLVASVTVFSAAACGGSGAQPAGSVSTPQGLPSLGAPLPGLTLKEHQAFEDGLIAFMKTEGPADGLGPVFNGTSCGECHIAGAPGGSSPDITTSRVTRIGGMIGGTYTDLKEYGGPVMEARSLKEFIPTYPYGGEVPPPQAQYISHRMTIGLFGDGLIEAIPAQEIIDLSNKPEPDGIHGVPNIVTNIETGAQEVGRFGWKGNVSSLHVFAGDAYLNEMGVTSKYFPVDNLPQGRTDPAGADQVPDPEDHDGDVDSFTAFMRFLAPPAPQPPTPLTMRGEKLFSSINCGACHVKEMRTGPNPSAALSEKTIRLYSDLLLHHMGPNLADGIQQGEARGDQFKTAPLWGLSHKLFYLHDGRASTIGQAIMMHGGEASASRNRFANLSPQDRQAIIAFLSGL